MSAAMEPTVFLVDNDQPVRKDLCSFLKSSAYNCEPYGSGDDFLTSFNPERPGCLVTDLNVPGIGGLDLPIRLRERGHELPVIFITSRGDVQTAVRAMKLGAVDFLEKPLEKTELLEAVDHAIEMDRNRRARRALRRRTKILLESLTAREREVMALVVAGNPNKIIAHELELSVKTVEYHRGKVMAKLNVNSVAELVKLDFLSRQ